MSKIPQTDSVTELARFWDSHDLTEFEDELEEIRESVFDRGGQNVVHVRLQPEQAATLRRIAQAKGIDETQLVRDWVDEKLRASRSKGGVGVRGRRTDRNPSPIRREYGLEVLSKATVFAEFTDGLERRARELNALGIRPLDALHLASAVAAEADFLCTCDDRFLRKGEGTTMVQNAKESASPPLWRA